MRRARAAALALAGAVACAGAAACAGPRAALDRPDADTAAEDASARELARAGLDAWLVRNDAATAGRRLSLAVKRDPADPWARLGAALLARRDLDDDAELRHLVALVQRAPAHPLVPAAARRLAELAAGAPARAQAVEAGLAEAQPRLRGLAAVRARAARAAALGAVGEAARAAALRAENGTVTAWALAGPYPGLHALDLDTRYPPDEGPLPASVPGEAGLPPVPVRAIPVPDAAFLLDGEGAGDVYYLAADAELARGGDYLLTLSGSVTLRLAVDGAPLVERRAFSSFAPLTQAVPVRLAPGRHRLLAKLGRDASRVHLVVALARADGAPSDARYTAAEPGAPAPAVRDARSGGLPAPLPGAVALAGALEREGGALAPRLLLARDALEVDREAAKELVEAALSRAPASAALLAVRALARRDDPTLAERVGRARAEADLAAALEKDPGDAAARLARAELARAGGRLDDAAEILEALPPAAAPRPRALLARARLAQERNLADRAEALAEEARRAGGECAALELLLDAAGRREAQARQDELATAFAKCPGGRERLVELRRRRGDLAGALTLATALAEEAPARLDGRFARAGLLAAQGGARAAADDLAALARLWPRSARVEKRRAELLEEAGDAAGARAARERALLLDPSDLALRRALALDEGREPLADLDEDGPAAVAAYRRAAVRSPASSVTVLDLGAIDGHPGGGHTELVHTVVEARDQHAVDQVGEVQVPEGAALLLARTLKRDGRVLDAEEAAGDKRSLSLPGLEPGDFAEWAWLRSVGPRGAGLPGFAADPFFFQADMPLWRTVYTAVAPPEVALEVDAHNLAPPLLATEGGRKRVRVARERVPPRFPEPGAPADAEHLPFVQVGAGAGQLELARALADGVLETFRPSLEVRALAAEIRAALPAGAGAEALARAAFRRVDEVVFGTGGSWTEPAGSILSRGRGSRTVLLESVLDALGVPARVVLVRDFARDPRPYRFARAELYPYAVLRVGDGDDALWLDPTTRGAPAGVLPAALRGCEGLVLPGAPGEEVRVVRTPRGEPERRRTVMTITVDADGHAAAEGREEYVGHDAAALRSAIERLDAAGRKQAFEAALSRAFRSPSLLGFEVDGERVPGAPMVLRWRARVERWARVEGTRAVVDAPPFTARLTSRYVQRPVRETPLLLGLEERTAFSLTVNLPAGWRPSPGPPAEVRSAYGRYARAERAEAGRLVRDDAFDLERGRVPPADFAGFAGFAASVDAAQEEPMTFELTTPGPEAPRRDGA